MEEEVKIVSNSILDTIKKMLGVPIAFDGFDQDLIVNINSVFSILSQMGVESETNKHFKIDDNSATWDDFIDSDEDILECVKTYVYLKVRLLFDPPSSSVLVDSINNQIKELEYRLYTQKGGY